MGKPLTNRRPGTPILAVEVASFLTATQCLRTLSRQQTAAEATFLTVTEAAAVHLGSLDGLRRQQRQPQDTTNLSQQPRSQRWPRAYRSPAFPAAEREVNG